MNALHLHDALHRRKLSARQLREPLVDDHEFARRSPMRRWYLAVDALIYVVLIVGAWWVGQVIVTALA